MARVSDQAASTSIEIWGDPMQLDGSEAPVGGPADGIAATFAAWANAHRSYGGDFNESALRAGVQATLSAYRGGLAINDAFEMGRQAYYNALI